jgi:hypothetical protein
MQQSPLLMIESHPYDYTNRNEKAKAIQSPFPPTIKPQNRTPSISPTTLPSISIVPALLTSLAIPTTADTRDLKPIPLPRQTPPHLALQLPRHSLVILL